MTIRVLHVINGLGTGGSERSLAEVVRQLPEHGIHSIVAFFYRRTESIEDQIVAAGIDLRFIRAQSTLGRALALRRLMKAASVDLLHTTHFEADLAGRLAALRTGVPVISSLVSTPYAQARFRDPRVNVFKLAAVRAVDRWTGRLWNAHFHAVSHTVKNAAVRQTGFLANRITVVERGRGDARLGEPSPERRDRARRNLGLERGDEVLVHVARHDYSKGQRDLLAAVAELLPGHPRLVLLIAGREDSISADLHRLHERLELGNRVRFLGHREDVPEILSAADLFVFPSLYEGLPGAVVEAMAMGLPIVASRIDGIVEVVEEEGNAALSEPESPRALARQIHELLGAPQRMAAFGKRSREIFEARFTLEQCTRRMAALLRQVAGEHPAARSGAPTQGD